MPPLRPPPSRIHLEHLTQEAPGLDSNCRSLSYKVLFLVSNILSLVCGQATSSLAQGNCSSACNTHSDQSLIQFGEKLRLCGFYCYNTVHISKPSSIRGPQLTFACRNWVFGLKCQDQSWLASAACLFFLLDLQRKAFKYL